MTTPDPLQYATPTPPPRNRFRRWLSRRAVTSGPRMISLALLALTGVMCMAPSQNNVLLYDWGDRVFRIALGLFAIEYLFSFFH